MKVALLLTGLPNKVKEGYNQYWKHIVENYDTDVYSHFWEDSDYHKVLKTYTPVRYIQEKPFKFTNYKVGIGSPNDDFSNINPKYDVAGNFNQFPALYSLQTGYNLINKEYDCIISSRYDIGSDTQLNLDNLDLSKINVSSRYSKDSGISDDNLSIMNQQNADIIFKDIFEEFIAHHRNIGRINFSEQNFTEIIQRKNLLDKIKKLSDIQFNILTETKI